MIVLKRPETPEEFAIIEDIQRDAWGAHDLDITPRHIIGALAISNSCVFLAYIDNKPVGFVWGFLSIDTHGELFLHSHQLGVMRAFQNKNVGFILKLKQREFALRHDIRLVRWTYDPLQSKNAYFNITKLGALADEYIENLYGELKNSLNEGLPTDRFYVKWYIKSRRVTERIYRKNYPPRLSLLLDKVCSAIRIQNNNSPHNIDIDTPHCKFVSVEIPWDLRKLRHTEKILWRMKTRQVLQYYLKRGYGVIDFLIDKKLERSAYILMKDPVTVLHEPEWWSEFLS